MAGEVRKAIGALELLAESGERCYSGGGKFWSMLAEALEAILEVIKAMEEDIVGLNERVCELEQDKKNPAGF